MPRLFVYGTLMFPEVVEIVAGEPLEFEEAVLDDYERLSLHRRVYPAIVPRPRRSVAGLLVAAVSSDLLARFDAFEDLLYDRLPVAARIGNRVVEAQAYVLGSKYRDLATPQSWEPGGFMQEHGEAYLARCREWAKTGAW